MKGDFIAIASHELRTPLGLILGHAAFLQDGATPDVAEHLSVIIRGAERLKAILDELSRLTHSDQGVTRLSLQVFPVKELLDEVVVKFTPAAKEKYLSLDLECKPVGLVVEGDRQKLQVALGNLIDNAIAFTDTGGHTPV